MCNKIINRFYLKGFAAIIFLTVYLPSVNAQKSTGLKVITRYKTYRKQAETDSLKKMIELRTIMPNIRYDLRYATLNNFMKERLYASGKNTFLRKPVAEALSLVRKELNEKGFDLLIWDAYRPFSVTVQMWKKIGDERYVADPKKGSGHNRGIAVDLTLISLSTGEELNMGTGFDNFSDTAHSTFTQLSPVILQNRQLLRATMEKYGFTVLPTEWWHFYWKNGEEYDVLDLPFVRLKQ
jgi:D-alanyl-D-alanine dipeptidase